MNGERRYELRVYSSSDGMSMQFINERQQSIGSVFLDVNNPNKARLLTVFKEAVNAELEQLFYQLITCQKIQKPL